VTRVLLLNAMAMERILSGKPDWASGLSRPGVSAVAAVPLAWGHGAAYRQAGLSGGRPDPGVRHRRAWVTPAWRQADGGVPRARPTYLLRRLGLFLRRSRSWTWWCDR